MGMTASVQKFDDMLGVTMVSVTGTTGGSEMVFTSTAGDEYRFYDQQDCCATCYLEDYDGDLNDLCGSPITVAEAVSEDGADEELESSTWTFLKFGTSKGAVTVRWFGHSNGYYAESPGYSVRAVSSEMRQKQRIDTLEQKCKWLESWIRGAAHKYELDRLSKDIDYVKGDVRPILEKMGELRCTYTQHGDRGGPRCTRPHGHWNHGSPEHVWERT